MKRVRNYMTLKKASPALVVLVYQIPSREKQDLNRKTENKERAQKCATGSTLFFLVSPTN